MRLYFAGYTTDPEIFAVEEADSLLESYVNFRKKDYRAWHEKRNLLGKDLFFDSGAFSAFTMGIKIDLREYIAYVKRIEDMLEVYAVLDVIGDPMLTAKNLTTMEEAGLKPLPVFHFGSPMELLEMLLERYNYIGLGGLVPLSMDRQRMTAHLDNCFSIIKDRAKVHGFGVNALWAWLRYPFFSVDATSWLTGGKYRRMVYFHPQGFRAVKRHYDTPKSVAEFKVLTADYKTLNLHNVKEYLKASEYVTELWNKRGIRWAKRTSIQKN